ncbi:hypothetical protein EMCRGX_G009576 [Ephydatia muelleri]
MEQVLQGVPKTQCLLDDIIVTGATEDEHLRIIGEVLARLDEYGMTLNKAKYAFFKSQIEFCGLLNDADGLHKSQEKIKAVSEAPTPQDLLWKQARWNWTTDCSTAFEKVKRLIASELVLTHFTPDRPLVLSCDASAYGLGALLSHNGPGGERPIAFASQTLADSEQKDSPIEKEELALVGGIKRLEQYLLGNQFTLITDHQPLASILHPEKGLPSVTAARPHTCRYAVLLSGYSYDIRYRNTTSHANADALSRLPLVRERPDEEIEDCGISSTSAGTASCDSSSLARSYLKGPSASKSFAVCTSRVATVVQEEILKPYTERQLELSTEQGCLMWGIHVVNITGQGPRRATWRSH